MQSLTSANAFNPGKGRLDYQADLLKIKHVNKKHGYRDHYFVDTPVIDRRIRNQYRRIQVAWHAGELARPQLRRLRRELTRIEGFKYDFASDGVITRYERHRLLRMINRNSRRIARARYGWKWWAYEFVRPYQAISTF